VHIKSLHIIIITYALICFGLSITTDVAKFLHVTLKRVSLPPGASSERQALVKKLDDLQQSYPQLYWELEDDDGSEQTELGPSTLLASSFAFVENNLRNEC